MAVVKIENKRLLKRLGDWANIDFRKPNKEFAQYMRVQVDSMFRRNRSGQRGGTHRGITWDGFKPQYTRKDGTVIPAWGGVKKVRGRGRVKGRKRPSGTRITRRSSLMQDTGTMRSRAALVIKQNQHKTEMGPQGVRYAAKQQNLRPFLFFIDKDARKYGNIIKSFLRKGDGDG